MNTRQILALAFVTGTCAASYAGGHAEWAGYPVEGVVYKFEVYTGLKDRWDSTKQDAPPLAPGRALRAAKQFISKVPLREDMKEWGLRDITLQTLSPDEWVYVVHFDANPKSGVWNGPVPWIAVPVRMDGTIPKPVIERKKP